MDYKYEQEPVMVHEIKAFERAGGGRVGIARITADGGELSQLQQKIDREHMTPEQRFEREVNKTILTFNNEGILSINDTDAQTLLEKIPSLSKVKYLNPTSYVLGYMATKGGRVLDPDKDRLQYIIRNVLPQISDAGVEAPDVVRYSRYWYNLT